MNLNSWFKKFCIKGKAIDHDSVAGVQCVDLFKSCAENVYGVPMTKGKAPWGNAADYWNLGNASWAGTSKLSPYFFKIPNTKTFKPMFGDWAIWGSGYSKSHNAGHIAFCDGVGNLDYFMVYQQNRNGNNDPISYNSQTYYKDFKGVLRPYRFVKKAVNIRSGPSTNSAIKGEYGKGAKVKVLDISGEWLKTDLGWCNNHNGNFFYEIGDKK